MTSREPVGLVGAAAATVVLGLAAGVGGLLAGLGTVGLWALGSAPYAYAAGLVLAAVALPETAPPVTLLGVGVGLLALLAGPLQRTGAPLVGVLALMAATAGLLAVAWATAPAWLGVLAMALVAALIAYGIHRYEVVALGLVAAGEDDG